MALPQIVVFALLAGLTEFLPVSFDSHLSLLAHFTELSEPTAALTLAVLSGALLAVLAYFWEDTADMVTGVYRAAKGKRDPGARLALQLLVGTLPLVAAAVAYERYVGDAWDTAKVIAWTTTGFGVLLLLLDSMSMTLKRVEHASYGDVIILGVMQALMLLPGTGRAVLTMTTARLLGYERIEAARISMLLSVPAIIAGIVWSILRLRRAGEVPAIDATLIGAAIAFFAGLIVIAVMMAWLRRGSFLPFALYRIALGITLLVLAYGLV